MITAMEEDFRSFDGTGKMIRSGRGCKGQNGMVAAGKYEASKAGAEIFKKGGNAVDAAVAAGFALGVCEPNASGLGGGGFMTARISGAKDDIFIDFREVAPKMAGPDIWSTENAVEEGLYGGKSVGVPGEVAGLLYALENYGTMSLEEVMEPAIKLAEGGYVVTPLLSQDIRDNMDRLKGYKAGALIYLKDGRPYMAGETLKNPDLANTLRKIASGGRDAFYKGQVAEAIVEAVRRAGGVLTMEDLAAYEVRVRRPVAGSYRGYEIVSAPPPSCGGIHLIQILNVLEYFDIAAMEVNSCEYLHLLSEVFKQCYADRAEYLGDTDFVKVPVQGLLSKAYAGELAGRIDLNRAQHFGLGNPWAFEHKDTTHFSAADRAGNMVSVTQTIDHFFGSCVVADGTGIVLNNQMSDFCPGYDKPNSVEPYKKPLSSMAPTLIFKEGRPYMALGSPGGSKIISTLAQVISKVIDKDMELQAAIDSPRMSDDTDNEILYESRISRGAISKLVEMGHKTMELGEWERLMGAVQAVSFEDNGVINGAADPRRDGKALGY